MLSRTFRRLDLVPELERFQRNERWYSNVLGIDREWVRMLVHDEYKHVGDYTATELPKSPRQLWLGRRHAHETVTDVSGLVYRVLGTAIHGLLEATADPNTLSEERFSVPTILRKEQAPVTVTGQVDCYRGEGLIKDHKSTGYFAFAKGIKTDWEAQLNVLAALARANTFPVKRLQINAFIRDWMRSKVYADPEYPRTQVVTLDVPMWDKETCWKYIVDRIAVHEAAKDVPDSNLPLCTPEERWERPEQWAAKQLGAKRASKCCETRAEASDWINHLKRPDDYEIEHRPGKPVRCLDYCDAAPWCTFAQVWWATNGEGDKDDGDT